MIKFQETQVVFKELPEEITLAINISNCPFRCKGCHSPHLWRNEGLELNIDSLEKLINKNAGITCVAFMGGDRDPNEINRLANWVKINYKLKTCWFSGSDSISEEINLNNFNYIKIGSFKQELGGLESPFTNQKLIKMH